VLIVDWDVHHGNGTNAIFHADPGVLFVSLHESPLYPGTGPASDLGSGDGLGYTANLPVPGRSGDETYRSLIDHVVVPLIGAWEPQLVLVSAGFDAHGLDPLATCRVTEGGYAEMTASLRRASAAVGAPLGLVLEGGYSLEALTGSVAALMPVLVAESPPEAGGDGVPAPQHRVQPAVGALALPPDLQPEHAGLALEERDQGVGERVGGIGAGPGRHRGQAVGGPVVGDVGHVVLAAVAFGRQVRADAQGPLVPALARELLVHERQGPEHLPGGERRVHAGPRRPVRVPVGDDRAAVLGLGHEEGA